MRQNFDDSDDQLHQPLPQDKGGFAFSSVSQQPKDQQPRPAGVNLPDSQRQHSAVIHSRFDMPPASDQHMQFSDGHQNSAQISRFEGPKKAQQAQKSTLLGYEEYRPDVFDAINSRNMQNSNLSKNKASKLESNFGLNIFPSSADVGAHQMGSNFQRPPPGLQNGLLSQDNRDMEFSSVAQPNRDNPFKPQPSNTLLSDHIHSNPSAHFFQPQPADPKFDQRSAVFNQPSRGPTEPQNFAPQNLSTRDNLNQPTRDPAQPQHTLPPSNFPRDNFNQAQPSPPPRLPATTGSRLNKDLSAWNVSPINQQQQDLSGYPGGTRAG